MAAAATRPDPINPISPKARYPAMGANGPAEDTARIDNKLIGPSGDETFGGVGSEGMFIPD
jgi:hypothetical protein